jgi:hypothetical protein
MRIIFVGYFYALTFVVHLKIMHKKSFIIHLSWSEEDVLE